MPGVSKIIGRDDKGFPAMLYSTLEKYQQAQLAQAIESIPPDPNVPLAEESNTLLEALKSQQAEFLSKQSELLAQQTADIQRLTKISRETANSTSQLADSTAKNEEISKRNANTALIFSAFIGFISVGITLYGIQTDSLGDANWQREQIQLLRDICKQLESLEKNNPVISEDIQAINGFGA